MTIYNCLFEPKKSAIKDGAVALAISIEAPNKKVAESIVIGKLWEHYPANGDNYFKPKIWEDSEGQPRPEVGKFDEQFAQTNTFDGEKWIANKPDTSVPGLPSSNEIIDLMKLPARERFAAVLMFSNSPIDDVLYSQVLDYLDNLENNTEPFDDDDRINSNILHALHNNEPVRHMHIEGLNNLIQAIFAKFEDQTPGKAAISQFIKRWLENPGKREEMVPSKTSSLNTSDNIESPKVAPLRGYKHTYATLDQEIAVALLPISPDTPVLSGNLRDAEKIIAEDREDFKRWSMALRTTEKILKYDRPSIFGVIQNTPAKDIYHFPESLRRHIDSWLTEHGQFECPESDAERTGKLLAAARGEYVEGISDPNDPKWVKTDTQPQVSNLGNGMFSVDNLMSEAASNECKKQEVTEQGTVTDDQATQARETLNSMGYGVYATNRDEAIQQEEKLSDKVKNIVQDVDQLVERIKREEQFPQASELVQSINEMQSAERDNLELWKNVFKTDERFTTAFSVNGGGTSINGTYMTMIATREFGPKGIGWGVDILEERFDNGAPITRTVKGTDGNNTWELIPDGVGGVLTEKHHVIKIRLWYIRNSVRGEEISFGCTPYIYGSKYGPICDGEATKKSLTDATKKALSALGFCADIFMGLYDNPEYRQKNKAEFALKNASENAEDAARVRQELDDKLTRVANTIASAVSENEINKVYSSIAREAEVHRKDAEAKGDTQHARYLGGRLRRLTTIKNERIAELNKAQEKAE
ncbi:hypothetical protein CSU64_05455 [Salmonella enterica subsp. enterica serovar Adjame]|uniref:Uncharacterized protein n=1 Tax=Salmonella enterica subsp. enterica serovar Adjame TaxID=2021403 RepID=A0A5X7X7S7_SALET|nr:hypothetical protein [Salmonella enterica]EBW7277956.1 hypothetical protein [Salmonella enterica subsp. enterica serovar Typhimurium]EBW9965393.1 hypothetical protein [Salmonella enterica subsp. enterica serovar Malstatt]EBY1391026.1 hypothetical protein [Salmonella enterica subsp. enterica serovar Wagenia]EDQ6548731.1 hypothetical protein [Salmonella enterica subsp. enterica]EDY1044076.1 hypothetical protein [Salmonella enterica subsp. enterica serovar Eko]EHC3795123.1 hypothetical protei